jgi:ribose transport system permease protein
VGKLFMIPIPVIVAICMTIVFIFMLSQARLGRYTFAIGGNREACERAGILVEKHLIIVYTICGFCAGVSEMLVLARFVAALPVAGLTDNLDSITAIVLEGTRLGGGMGSMFGSAVCAFIIGILLVGLIVIGVEPYWQMVPVGIILIIAVSISQLRQQH